MDNKNPFEIRLELLQMAKDMLCDQYYAERDVVMREYENKIENDCWHAVRPVLPPYPTEEQIIAKADLLNAFVSGGASKF